MKIPFYFFYIFNRLYSVTANYLIMNENYKQRIDEILDDGYDFEIGTYLRRGYEIFKKNAGGFIGFLLLSACISGFAQIIPLVGIVISTIVIGPAIMLGFYLVANKVSAGEHTEFNDFFKGFEHVGQLAAYTLVFLLFGLLIMSPVIYMAFNTGIIDWYREILANPMNPPTELPEFPTSIFLMGGLLIIPYFYLAVSYIFTPMYIGFYKMGFWDAMESSRKVVGKRFFAVFGLLIGFLGLLLLFCLVGGLIAGALSFVHWSLAGLAGFALVVALIAISPVYYCAVFAAFEDIMQMRTVASAGDDLIDHLVD